MHSRVHISLHRKPAVSGGLHGRRVQLSSFVLSIGHHLIPAQSTKETGPLKLLWVIVLSLSDKWMAGVHVWEGFRDTCQGLFYFHPRNVDLLQNTNVYDPKCAQGNHIIHQFPPLLYCLSACFSSSHFTVVQHKTITATTGPPELTNPYEGCHGSHKPSPGHPTWGSVLWLISQRPRVMV